MQTTTKLLHASRSTFIYNFLYNKNKFKETRLLENVY